MERTFLLNHRADTIQLGETLGALLRSGDVLALVGDLGSGKTTLTQAIARGMGIAVPVTSPTFTLIQEYPGRLPMFHFDPYRLRHPEEATELGFEEYFAREGVVVVEWADKIAALLPPERLTLTLEILDEEREDANPEDAPRRLTATATGERPAKLLAQWAEQRGTNA